ncbi:toxin TumE [Leptodesmis sp.]|uniref:toxin TumE n=1 Tax=Leptodesmis sp. TaxID=3100501 RepID=UPI0040534B80
MLPNRLSDYLNQVEQAVLQCSIGYVERYEEEILTLNQANLRIRLRFNQTHLLEINEAIVITDNQLEFLDYRYHFQDEQNRLIFRYDSTPHFPNLPNFPHHKHLPDAVIASEKPEIIQVLKEATAVLG